MTSSFVVTGVVRDASLSIPVAGAVVCLVRDGTAVAESRSDTDGSFTLSAPASGGTSDTLLVLASGLEAWRQRLYLSGEAARHDVGTIEVWSAEYPPGIHGQLWDTAEDRPIPYGRVALESGGHALATQSVTADGTFSFALTCALPMPPGDYAVVAEASGYAPGRATVAVADNVTLYQLGRVELAAAAPPDAVV